MSLSPTASAAAGRNGSGPTNLAPVKYMPLGSTANNRYPVSSFPPHSDNSQQLAQPPPAGYARLPPPSMLTAPSGQLKTGHCLLVAAICVLTFEYLTYVLVCLFPMLYPLPSDYGIAICCAFHVVYLFTIITFSQCATTEPGIVPAHWGFYLGEGSKRGRYCKVCNVWKPERTHHCSACGKCVLNMDHHCPWLSNCVGFYNRKFFIQLLFYIIVSLLFVDIHGIITLITKTIYQWPRLDADHAFSSSLEFISMGLCCIMLFVSLTLTLTIIPFTKFHLALVTKNSTTIDNMDVTAPRGRYDLGTKRNLEQVLGANVFLWWFPFHTLSSRPVGDGIRWRKHYLRSIDEVNESTGLRMPADGPESSADPSRATLLEMQMAV